MPSAAERFRRLIRCAIVAPQAVKIENCEQGFFVTKARRRGTHRRPTSRPQPHHQCRNDWSSHRRPVIRPRRTPALARDHRTLLSHHGLELRRRHRQRVREISRRWRRFQPHCDHRRMRADFWLVRPEFVLESAQEELTARAGGFVAPGFVATAVWSQSEVVR
jgi:hypothetical protein